MRHRGPALALGTIVLAAALAAAAPATALVLDDDDATVEATATAGGFEAEIALLNATDDPIALPRTLEVSEDCTVRVGRAAIPPNRTSDVTLTIPEDCFPKGTTEIHVEIDPAVQTVRITAPDPPDRSDWAPLWLGLIVGIGAALVVLLRFSMWLLTAAPVLEPTKEESGSEQNADYERVTGLVDAKLSELGFQAPEWKVLHRVRVVAGRPLKDLDSTWSLQDSLVSTTTVGTTGVLALLSSTDLLTAVLGEEPSATIAVMTVAGLINAAVIALAAAFVQLLSRSGITIKAMITGSTLVTFAGVSQVIAVGLGAAAILSDDPVAYAFAFAATVALAFLVVTLTVRATEQMLTDGVRDQLPSIPDDARTAWQTTTEWDETHLARQILSDYKDWLASTSLEKAGPGLTAQATPPLPAVSAAPPKPRRRAVLP